MPRLMIQPLRYFLQLFLNLLSFSGLYGFETVFQNFLKCPQVELISLQFLSLSVKRTLKGRINGLFESSWKRYNHISEGNVFIARQLEERKQGGLGVCLSGISRLRSTVAFTGIFHSHLGQQHCPHSI